MSDALEDNHNRMSRELVLSLVQSVRALGGDERQICVLLESVCVGTLLFVAKQGGEKVVMQAIADRAVERAAQLRPLLAQAQGSA